MCCHLAAPSSRHFAIPIRTLERFLVSYVVDQENAHRASVVGSGDCSKAFLASGIPDLQLHPLAIEFDCADLEVNADGCDEGGGK